MNDLDVLRLRLNIQSKTLDTQSKRLDQVLGALDQVLTALEAEREARAKLTERVNKIATWNCRANVNY